MHTVLWSGVAFLGFLQITAVLLNLIPIPGLDGYSALEPHLSPENQRALDQFKPYGFVLLFVLLMARPVNQLFFGIVTWFFNVSGVPPMLVNFGMQLSKVWNAWL
jgi:Zn-dependent protease